MCVALLAMAAFRVDAAELPALIRLEALAVPYASPWQRATPQQETADDALLLDLAEASLQLAVPRHTRRLKIDADSYYIRLRESWQKLYGGGAKISWLESGGRKWLACLHPSQDRGISAFHLSTVFAGRAYSVLVFAPSTEPALPKAALDLLAGMRFADETAPLIPKPDSATPKWIKTRTIYPQANADVLEALVQDDLARLGGDGMVTGYGLDFIDSGVAWFIEGYQWKTVAARVTRVPWQQGGRLEVQAAAEAAAWPVKLTLKDNETDVRASLRVITLCAPSQRVAETLDQLQRGARQTLQRLLLERAAGCPTALPDSSAPSLVQGESGKTVQADVAVSLPPVLGAAEHAALRAAGLTRIGLVEIRLAAGPHRTGFGDRLLERARWYVVFEPGGAEGR
jgi:hypothetical protein